MRPLLAAAFGILALPAAAQDMCQDLGLALMCDPQDIFLDYVDEQNAIIPGEFQYDANTDAIVAAFPNQSPGVLTAEMMASNMIGAHAGAFGLTTDDMIGHGGQDVVLPGEDVVTAAYSFVLGEEAVTYLTSTAVDDERGILASTIHYGPPGALGVTPERLAIHEALLGTVSRK